MVVMKEEKEASETSRETSRRTSRKHKKSKWLEQQRIRKYHRHSSKSQSSKRSFFKK